MKKRIWYQSAFLAALGCFAILFFTVFCEAAAPAVYSSEENGALPGNASLQMSDAVLKAELSEAPEETSGPSMAEEAAKEEGGSEGESEETAEIEPSETPEEPVQSGTPEKEPGSSESEAEQGSSETPEETQENTPSAAPGQVSGEETNSAAVPEITETPPAKMDFRLTVTADEAEIKAGTMLLYQVTVENTGDCHIRNLEMEPVFQDGSFSGEWEEAPGLSVYESGGRAVLELLEKGCSREFLYYLNIPEEQESSVLCAFSASASSEENPEAEASRIKKEVELETQVIPLTVQFSVKKTADRAQAAPGDRITYQICIRNTGERVLHSVLTTERFLTEGIEARFLEQEGVLLNGAASQALISRIEPGEAVGLLAEVTLPENITAQELINEVSVVTKETGESVYEARSSVQVICPEENYLTDVPENYSSDAQKASTHPQTSDGYCPEVWTGVLFASLAAAAGTIWRVKGKRKH